MSLKPGLRNFADTIDQLEHPQYCERFVGWIPNSKLDAPAGRLSSFSPSGHITAFHCIRPRDASEQYRNTLTGTGRCPDAA
jgi:hypothetical protein